ncbi:hypothetical protein B0H11DRAFT_1898747 [Mycena galericulata]|nr:hypothetical protein B0H11DRAFT_1898747 [Mycena galericulata]
MARGKRQRSPTPPPEDPVLPHHVWRVFNHPDFLPLNPLFLNPDQLKNTPPEECRRLVGKAVPVLRNFLRIFWSKNIDTPKEFKRYFTPLRGSLKPDTATRRLAPIKSPSMPSVVQKALTRFTVHEELFQSRVEASGVEHITPTGSRSTPGAFEAGAGCGYVKNSWILNFNRAKWRVMETGGGKLAS